MEDKTDGLDTVIYDLQLPFFSQNINATKCSTTGNQWLSCGLLLHTWFYNIDSINDSHFYNLCF